MNSDDSFCPVCHLGRLRERTITYTQIHEGQFVVIPNVAALVCDVCGEKLFDKVVLRRLNGLLGGDRHNPYDVQPGQLWP